MQSKYKALMNNTIIFAVGNILVKLISFVLMPLYTVVLTTEQYAVSELLNSMIEVILPIMTLCIIEALYRFALDKETDFNNAFMNAFYIIVIGDVIVVCVCALIQYIMGYQYAMAFALLFFASTFYKLVTQFARGLGYSKLYASGGVINAIVLVIVNVILLVIFQGGVHEYLLSFSIAYIFAGTFVFILAKEYRYIRLKAGDVNLLKSMLAYGLPSIPNMLAWWINSVSDRYIVMAVCGAGAAGLYTVASKLPALINLVSTVFQQAWQYSTAKEIEDEGRDDFFSKVFRVYAPVCYIACGCLIVCSPFIAKILFQKEFYSAWHYVPFLLVAATVGCFSTFFGTFFNAVKKNMVLMNSTVAGAMINIILNLILIPIYGVMAATITTLISYIAVTVIRVISSRKYVRVETDILKDIFSVILLILEAGLVSFGGEIGYVSGVVGCIMLALLHMSTLIHVLKSILCRRI